jgi:hypothetical protein
MAAAAAAAERTYMDCGKINTTSAPLLLLLYIIHTHPAMMYL